MKKTFVAAAVLAILAGAAHAALTMVEDFETRALGSINTQGDWVAQDNSVERYDHLHSNVVYQDGDKALELVGLSRFGTRNTVYTSLDLGTNSIPGIGTVYLRFKSDGPNDTILGTNSRNPGYLTNVEGVNPAGSHENPPNMQGQASYAYEGALTRLSGGQAFRARDGGVSGAYREVDMGQASNVWQELWIQVDCANARSMYYLATTDGGTPMQVTNPATSGVWWGWRNQAYVNTAVTNLKWLISDLAAGRETTIWVDTIAVDTAAHVTNRITDTPATPFTNTVSTGSSGPGTATPTHISHVVPPVLTATQIVFQANQYHEILHAQTDGTPIVDAIGETNYTLVLSNVEAEITNFVAFTTTMSPDGKVPATWYGPLGANPALEDEDGDGLSLHFEYLINTDPTVSNAFKLSGHGITGGGDPFVTWDGLGEPTDPEWTPHGDLDTAFASNLLAGTWTAVSGAVTHAVGVTTWTWADTNVAPPAVEAEFRLDLTYLVGPYTSPSGIVEDFEGAWSSAGNLVADPENTNNTCLELVGAENIAIAMPTNAGTVTMRIFDKGAWSPGTGPAPDDDYGPRWGLRGIDATGTNVTGSAAMTIINKSFLGAQFGYGVSSNPSPTADWFSLAFYGAPRHVHSLQTTGTGTHKYPEVRGVGQWTTWSFDVGPSSVDISDDSGMNLSIGVTNLPAVGGVSLRAWASGGHSSANASDMATQGVLIDDIAFTP